MKTKWMKKILAGALSAAMCCGMLTGCGKGVEQTNEELNIYVSENSYSRVNYPIRLYQQKYPNVKVNVDIISKDAEDFYYDKIRSNLMTGNDVADLLIVDSTFTAHCDIYKIEKSGAFIDLNPLLKGDQAYDETPYYEPIIQGLEYDGKQYIYPLAFSLPYIVSTEEKLTELGIDLQEFQNLDVLDFFQLIQQKQQEYGLSVNEVVTGNLFSDTMKQTLINWYLTDAVDYAKESFALDATALQALLENMDSIGAGTNDIGDQTGYLYAATTSNELAIQSYIRDAVLPADETPVMTCLRDKNGNINANVWLAAAIPQLSPNQQNAYDLLQILLSEEVQNFKPDDEDNGLAQGFACLLTGIMRRANFMWSYSYYGGEDYAAVRNADFAYREEVSGSFLRNEWSKLIMEQAEEYYKGNCSAEQAVESVEKKLKIYVSE